jgi:O-antigen biosynthesis protein WbqP
MQNVELEIQTAESYTQHLCMPGAEFAGNSDLAGDRIGFNFAKRLADIVVSALVLVLGSPLLALITLLVRWTSPGPALYWSVRFGKYNAPFSMPKFRTMCVNAPEVPTNELESPESYVTPIGSFLRKSSLDELPQFWSILVGEMSLIGPRPVICAEIDLAQKRADAGVDQLTPGLTGWAQINGRDSVTIEDKVRLDRNYLENRSIQMDHAIIYATICRVLSREGIAH